MKGISQITALFFSLVLGVSLLVLGPNLSGDVSASESRDGDSFGNPERRAFGSPTPRPPKRHHPRQRPENQDSLGLESRRVAGVVSNALECLAVGNDVPAEAAEIVKLTWRGRVERARLIVSVSGTEAAHTIKVNGQPVAQAPMHPEGQPCSDGESFYLDIPREILVQGDNLIEITNDALPDDSWTAANVRLEVLGDLLINVPDSAEPSVPADLSATAATAFTSVFTFTNPYDGTIQEAIAQEPGDYVVPAPLLIAVHPRSSAMEWGIDEFGDAANSKGWLLASPQLHGSWPVLPNPPGKYAYASLESQYDVIGTVQYMLNNYSIDLSRIYLVGYSMGGQGGVVTAAKFPHLFAAVFDNKGPTDMIEWYDEQVAYYGTANKAHVIAMRQECHIGGIPKTPAENPFCYQRRSGIHFAGNYLHTPISMTHSISDALVPIHHSRDLRDAINSYGPDRPASVFEDNTVTCSPDYHCYAPAPEAVLDFLEPFTLNNNPTHIHITTDESKSYYWMNLAQTGGDHWAQVETAYYPISATVRATISDTRPLIVGFNLGSTPIMGLIEQPGMGLPATTYLVRGGGNNRLHRYTSGYLTTTLTTTGQFALTISAIEASLAANPAMVSGWQTATSTITAVLKDHLNNPIPDGTAIQFSTTEGTFPNGGSIFATSVTGGQVTTTLTLTPDADSAEIIASVESITASTVVDVIHPAIDVLVTPDQTIIYSGQAVTFTYQLTNSGDVTLTGVTLVDDSGTICEGITLAADATESCSRNATLTQDTTIMATVTGKDPLGNDVTDSDSNTVMVISPAIDLLVMPNQSTIYSGQVVTYVYQLTNSGNITLTNVALVDDGGPVCEDIVLSPEATQSCRRSVQLFQTTTITATVTGKDPLGNDVTDSDSTTVIVELLDVKIYLPIVTTNDWIP